MQKTTLSNERNARHSLKIAYLFRCCASAWNKEKSPESAKGNRTQHRQFKKQKSIESHKTVAHTGSRTAQTSHNGISVTIEEKKFLQKKQRSIRTMERCTKTNHNSSRNHLDKSPHQVTFAPTPTPVPAESNTTD
jgi:hypothetical protein